ncbi:MAG: ferrous iron transport protein A [Planctomycetes bacterium]|nr:ferrous iron transport protein A [Planctomycetota bacterium]
MELIPLNRLGPGEVGQIDQVMGRPEHVQRLEELGLRGGRHIEMVQSGNPCIVRLDGQKICFRGGESLNVLVRPAAAQ